MTYNPVDSSPFVLGNQLWKLRKFNRGPEPVIKNPEHMIEEAIAYFDWAFNNPTPEKVIGWYEGAATEHTIYHPRALTIAGFCSYLGVGRNEWHRWKREREELLPAMSWVEAQMFDQKFNAAAAGLLNANIISRELGLADTVDHRSTDGTMTPKPTVIEFVAPQVSEDGATG